MARLLRVLRRIAAAYLLPPRRVVLTEAQWLEEPEDYRCCALDTPNGAGHEGPCAARCSDCGGTGRCPLCAPGAVPGCGCDDVVQCCYCDGNHDCPYCYEGLVEEAM